MQIANSFGEEPRRTNRRSLNGLPQHYQVKFIDAEGVIVAEQQVLAASYSAVLKGLSEVTDGATRIEVFNQAGARAGEVGVDYWRQRLRGRR